MSIYNLGATVRHLLDPALSDLGFALAVEEESHVSYVCGRYAITLEYGLEELPVPWLVLTVDFFDTSDGTPLRVALWRAYPDVVELRDPAVVRFNSQQSLEAQIATIRDEWLSRFIVPLIGDEERLRAVWLETERELDDEYNRRVREQELRRARRMYDAGDYRGDFDAYVLYGVDTLSAADRRRYVMARRFLHGSAGSR